MVGYHRLNGREFVQAPGDGEGQGSLACCSPWGRKESDTTEQLNNKGCCALSSSFTMSSWTELRISIIFAGRGYPLAAMSEVVSGSFINLF